MEERDQTNAATQSAAHRDLRRKGIGLKHACRHGIPSTSHLHGQQEYPEQSRHDVREEQIGVDGVAQAAQLSKWHREREIGR